MASCLFQRAFGRAISDSLRSRSIPSPCTFFTSFYRLQTVSIAPTPTFTLTTYQCYHPPTRTLALPFITTISTYASRPKIFQTVLNKTWCTTPHSSRSRMFSLSSRGQSPRHTPNPKRQSQYFQSLELIPTDILFWGIIGLNATVFAMWYLAGQQLVRCP